MHLATMTIHDSPKMNFLVFVTRNPFQHLDSLHDSPVLVIVPLALHAEHRAVQDGLGPFSYIRLTPSTIKTEYLSKPFGNFVVLEEPENGEDDDDGGDNDDEEGFADADVGLVGDGLDHPHHHLHLAVHGLQQDLLLQVILR